MWLCLTVQWVNYQIRYLLTKILIEYLSRRWWQELVFGIRGRCMTSSDLRWIIKTTSDSTFNVVFLFQEKILLRMSNHKQENFQAFPSEIPVHPPTYGIPYAGQQYDQPQVGQPSVQAHHLPAVTDTISLTYGRNPVRTICPHCGKTVSNTTSRDKNYISN